MSPAERLIFSLPKVLKGSISSGRTLTLLLLIIVSAIISEIACKLVDWSETTLPFLLVDLENGRHAQSRACHTLSR